MIAQIYVIAPYSSDMKKDRFFNALAAMRLGRRIDKMRAHAIVVHTSYFFADDLNDPDWWYDATRDAMVKLDAVVCRHNWEKSEGCRNEMAMAVSRDIPQFVARENLEIPGFAEWLEKWNRRGVAA